MNDSILKLTFRSLFPLVSLLLVGVSVRTVFSHGSEPARVGVVTSRPESGTVVEHDGKYLVPYQQIIPGTDVSFTMIPIPGGVVTIGSPDDEPNRETSEGPQRKIKIAPFWIGKCEVTWAEYFNFTDLCSVFDRFNDKGLRQVLDENRIDAITAPSKLYEPGFTFGAGEDPELPAVTMSQFSAKQYTKWLSLLIGDEFYRLPTEAEWEYACRAGTDTPYSFGSDMEELGDYAWHSDNSDDETKFVGQKKPNPWGLYDMHGNACEWVLDAYADDAYAALSEHSDSKHAVSGSVVSESVVTSEDAIRWPTKTYPRVLRGGSCLTDPEQCRSASRRASDNELRSYDPNTPKSPWWFASDESQDIGFRIVRPLEAPATESRGKYWDADVRAIKRVANFRIEEEGRGEWGLVDPSLPAAIKALGSE